MLSYFVPFQLLLTDRMPSVARTEDTVYSQYAEMQLAVCNTRMRNRFIVKSVNTLKSFLLFF